MRLLFVVQRYGADVAGGAELACREYASRMASRGHDVEVLTSTAQSYVDWANHYERGTTVIDDVRVHRLAVESRREDRLFGPLNARAVYGHKPVPLHLQREWMRMQGPFLPELVPWLSEHASDYDVVIFFTYLYFTTWAGLPVAALSAKTILHPCAHDEPPLYLPLFDTTFRHADAFGFFTEEEVDLVRRRFGIHPPASILGIGIDLDVTGDGERFRRRFALADRPYLLFVGRLDPGKGSVELHEFFVQYKRRNPGPLAMVFAGEPVHPLPDHDDVVVTGWLDEATRNDAIAGCTALVHPSYFESFSLVLAEAWSQRKPALVQSKCEVLLGQARRSGGAIAYHGFAEFEAAVDWLVPDEALRAALGAAGRGYVEKRYRWDTVLARYERLLHATAR